MSYFSYLSDEQRRKIFYLPPYREPLEADPKILAHALGATLYMPGTHQRAISNIMNNQIPGLISAVLCLEDAVDDRDVAEAEKNLAFRLKELVSHRGQRSGPPYIFIRIRNVEQLQRITDSYGPALDAITGFVYPKFEPGTGEAYLANLAETNARLEKTLYCMPILEDPGAINLETRTEHLLNTKKLLDQYKNIVLNVRVGATDLSGLYGLRRSPELTIYDIAVIRDFIADLVNILGRPQDGYVISGPVWEYFSTGTRVLKPQLRQTPFREQFGHDGSELRQNLLGRYMDGLIREVILDKANGLIGKTIIHPTHLLPVQALYVVTHEEYCDAADILVNSANGGVAKSIYNNKMNEAKPHTNWARKIMTLSKIYGVFNEHYDYTSIIYEGAMF